MNAEQPEPLTSEEYTMQALDAILQSQVEVTEMLETQKQTQAEAVIPVRVKVAMRCLEILYAGQGYTSVTKRESISGSSINTPDDQSFVESFHRHPSSLTENECLLRNSCCQFLANFLFDIGSGVSTD